MNCMYHPYGYAPSTGLLTEGTRSVYETPPPSHLSSDVGLSADCCQQLSPSTSMYTYPHSIAYQLNRFWHEKVVANKLCVQRAVEEVAAIVFSILKQVEAEEPRFACTLNKTANNRYEGLYVESPHEFRILLYLNHMAVFNYVDEGNVPGCAALKLSDGRKRSMSLWVEFITASGYLSARKIRAKFQSLIAQIIEQNNQPGTRLLESNNDVTLILKEKYKVHISPAFTWKDAWPRIVGNWVIEKQLPWPNAQLANEVMLEGVTLVSQESVYMKDKNASAEADSWVILLNEAEDRLIYSFGTGKKRVLSILKYLRDRHFDVPGGAAVTNFHLKTLVLFEAEKHVYESEWDEMFYRERILSILLQLIACLQSHQFQDYLLHNVDIFKGLDKRIMTVTSKAVWSLVRHMIINECCFDQL